MKKGLCQIFGGVLFFAKRVFKASLQGKRISDVEGAKRSKKAMLGFLRICGFFRMKRKRNLERSDGFSRNARIPKNYFPDEFPKTDFRDFFRILIFQD